MTQRKHKTIQPQEQLHLLEQPAESKTANLAHYAAGVLTHFKKSHGAEYIVQVRRATNPYATFKDKFLTSDITEAHGLALRLADNTNRDVRIQRQLVTLDPSKPDERIFSTRKTIAQAYVKDRPRRYVVLNCHCEICLEYAREWDISSVHNLQDVVYNQARRTAKARERFNKKYFDWDDKPEVVWL